MCRQGNWDGFPRAELVHVPAMHALSILLVCHVIADLHAALPRLLDNITAVTLLHVTCNGMLILACMFKVSSR